MTATTHLQPIETTSKAYADLKRSALSVIRNYCRGDGKSINGQDIYDGLQLCLNVIKVDGVVVHFGKDDLWQACFSLDCQATGKSIVKRLKEVESLQQEGCKFEIFNIDGQESSFIQSTIHNPDACKGGHDDSCDCEHSLDDIFLINPKKTLFGNLVHGESKSNEDWYAIFTTLREVFLRRNHTYRHFPPQLSQRYWEAVSLHNESREESYYPPWIDGRLDLEGKEPKEIEAARNKRTVSTITLSLDLRKSTIAMDQATDLGEFAYWMRELVQELTEIALAHLAVFDKFTGDGIIVHFLNDDVNRLIPLISPDCDKLSAMELAVICATKMITIVDQRLATLREFLQNDFANFGASVGLDVGAAKWSADHTGNPIVVGRGVVGACRNSGAPAGKIRLVNAADQSYRKTELYKSAPTTLVELEETKDFPQDLVVRVWELKASDVLKVIPPCAPFDGGDR